MQAYPEPQADEYKEVAWGLKTADSKFEPMWINRGVCGDDHVKFELLYSGICHTDCHIGKNHMGFTRYPCVPGHELIGTVTEVGKNVTRFKVGETVGVGCMVDTCLNCPQCLQGDE